MTKKTEVSRTTINVLIATAIGVAILLFFWFWYTNTYLNPERTFWSTINHNLKTGHVTRTSEQSYQTQTLKQITDVQYYPELAARSVVIINNSETKEKVVTETIGTPKADYLRYTTLETANMSGDPKNILNVWAVQQASESSQPQILNDALVGSILMFGNLNKSQREEILNMLQKSNAFEKHELLEKTTEGGKKVYKYKIVINLAKYIEVYKKYLGFLGQEDIAKSLGTQDPNAKFEAVLSVNAASRRPTHLKSADNQQAESYSNFGYYKPIETPDTKVTVSELQKRLTGN